MQFFIMHSFMNSFNIIHINYLPCVRSEMETIKNCVVNVKCCEGKEWNSVKTAGDGEETAGGEYVIALLHPT